MANDFNEVLDSVLPQLSGTDRSKRAAASAAVAMLLTQAPEGTHLSTRVLPAVSPLLSDDDCLVQTNACAALIAVAELEAEHLQASMQEWTQALDTVVRQLAGHHTDTALRIASAEVLGAVGRANAEAAQVVFDQHGVEALISVLEPEADAMLQESGVDSICKLAAAAENRQKLVQQGVLPALAKLLHSGNAEIHVRALLALGMLIGGNQEYQTQLADINGALPRLLALRLQQDEEDSKHVADGIVTAMLKNPSCKQQLTKALREHPKAPEAADKFL